MNTTQMQIQTAFSFTDPETKICQKTLGTLRWPCGYESYNLLREPLYKLLTDLPSAYADCADGPDIFDSPEDQSAAMWLALGLANSTLTQAVRNAIEIAHGAANGLDWRGSATEMATLTWLRSCDDTLPVFLDKQWQRKHSSSPLAAARRLAKNARTAVQLELAGAGDRPRQVTGAPLFEINRAKIGNNSGSITVDYPFLGLDGFAPEQKLRPDVLQLSELWSHEISSGIGAVLDKHLLQRLSSLVRYVLSATVSTAWRDMAHIRKRMPPRRLGNVLVSGTPTHAGRTLGWWYRTHGLAVERYAHGGDRGTHIDYGWDLIELLFCSRYVTHGALEKNNLEARTVSGAMCRNFPEKPAFETYGSPRHQQLFKTGRRKPKPKTVGRRILYVPGLYGTEQLSLSPTFKTPDHIYAEWQYWLIGTLKKLKFDVQIKLHPSGFVSGQHVLRETECQLIDGKLDPNSINYDCLLFDFPGSAWFDCLASQHAMVLMNMGARPLAPLTRSSIHNRCPVIKTHQNDRNLIRANPADVGTAISKAIDKRGCDDKTAKMLFWA